MGKANCPFCNSKNTFNIAYGYLGEKKDKRNYIDQHDIGKNISYRKGFNKYDFDGEKLISHLPNRYCKNCNNSFNLEKLCTQLILLLLILLFVLTITIIDISLILVIKIILYIL